MYNTKGRGFRGFKSIIETDHANLGVVTTTDFAQKFPLSSQVIKQTVAKAGANAPFSVQTSQWLRNPQHETYNSTLGLYHVYSPQNQRYRCDLNSTSCNLANSISQSKTLIASIDRYGNVLSKTSTSTDELGVQKSIVATTIDQSVWPQWKNKVNNSTATQSTTITGPDRPATSINGIDTNTAKTVVTNYTAWHTPQRKPKTVVVAPTLLSSCSSLDCVQTTTVLNPHGLPTSTSVTAGALVGNATTPTTHARMATFTYSTDGYFPATVTNGLGHTITTTTDPATGANLTTTNANGLVTTTTYDTLGRPTQVSGSGVPTQYIAYYTPDSNAPAHALMMAQTSQAGSPDGAIYTDQFGRTLRSRTQGFAGEWLFQDVQFDERGLKTHESTPYKQYGSPAYTTYTNYDEMGRAHNKSVPQIDGSLAVEYVYDGLKTTIHTTVSDGANLTMSRTYNSRNQLIQTVDAIGGTTRYAYNGGGSPIVIKDAANNSIYAFYDSLGRKQWVVDPNQGKTTFTYNGFGELEKELDANGKIITYDMDSLGRVISRNAAGSIATFKWDTLKKGLPSYHSENGIRKDFTYDHLSRPTSSTLTIEGTRYITATEYDANFGRPKSLKYPNNLTIGLKYNSRGYLTQEFNAASKYVYRQISAQDVWGNISQSCMASTSTTTTSCDNSFKLNAYISHADQTGKMLSTRVTGYKNASSAIIHHRTYSDYDSYGNLKAQNNLVTGIIATDSFDYDALHRLTHSQVTATSFSTAIDYAYDAVGNLLKKSDYSADNNSAYSYVAGKNQINSINLKAGGSTSFTYDNKGNLTHRNNALETAYNTFNKPTNINRLGANLDFTYGADLARYKQVRTVNGKTTTTHYIDKLYEVEKEGVNSKNKAYISDVAIVSDGNQPGDKKINFTLRDRLGSATTFADENGEATDYRHFDPFGKPMNGDWSQLDPARLANNPLDLTMPTRRGFTDHEHLDEVELIHMNGRVYDYNVGRFMSVDPVIQSPTNSQSMNPYSYIMNNPLSGTDPTGYTAEEDKAVSTGSRIPGNNTGAKSVVFNKASSPVKATVTQEGTTVKVHLNGGTAAQQKAAAEAITGHAKGKSTELGSQGSIAKNQGPGGGSGNSDMHRSSSGDVDFAAMGIDTSEIAGLSDPTDDLNDLGQTAGMDWTGDRALAYQVAGQAGVDAYNQGVDTGLEIGAAIAPLPPLISGARYLKSFRAATAISPNRLNHIFGKAEHVLDGVVKQYGSQGKAFRAIQKAANKALKSGKLTTNSRGILPKGDAGHIINVGGTKVRLIGGRVVNGKVEISSASRKGL